METDRRKRALSDDDVRDIVSQLKGEIVREFYEDIGKGAWVIVKKAMFAMFLALAGYGAAKGYTINPK